MPFVSQAQRRLFYARPELHKYIAEFEAATPKNLPGHVGQQRLTKKLAKKKKKRHGR